MPFSAIAGVDLNGDANITDYVPGITRNVFNRGSDTDVMALVNAYRATTGAAALPGSQIDTNDTTASTSAPASRSRSAPAAKSK